MHATLKNDVLQCTVLQWPAYAAACCAMLCYISTMCLWQRVLHCSSFDLASDICLTLWPLTQDGGLHAGYCNAAIPAACPQSAPIPADRQHSCRHHLQSTVPPALAFWIGSNHQPQHRSCSTSFCHVSPGLRSTAALHSEGREPFMLCYLVPCCATLCCAVPCCVCAVYTVALRAALC